MAECLDVPVVTQGRTLDETLANIREALTLYLENEDTEALGYGRRPSLLVLLETPLQDAA